MKKDLVKFYQWFLSTIYLSVIILSFLQVTLAKEVSVEVIPSIINLTIEEFHELAGKYRGEW